MSTFKKVLGILILVLFFGAIIVLVGVKTGSALTAFVILGAAIVMTVIIALALHLIIYNWQ